MRLNAFLLASISLVSVFVRAAPLPAPGLLGSIEGDLGIDTVDDTPICTSYSLADASDISSRNFQDIEARGNEEFFFRYETPDVLNSTSILQLPPRVSTKGNPAENFDDQAYKWISTDASKVQRGKIPGRVPTIYVLPAGTRAAIAAATKDFETTSTAQQATDFVTKDNEPGDVGIQGVQAGADGKTPLDNFRAKVIRTVVKQTSTKAGGKSTFTTIKGGKSQNIASKGDQEVLSGFC
ncbi:hypothetical protein BC834DRAFT_972440 [Gloeopeniophorella convolvens]|nr:hypothetical protein BC834DRAFT_972440 [Gloeopeniophorella convolvens]